MGAWVHEQTVTQHAGTVVCGACYIDNRSPCTTPEPDAASPCGAGVSAVHAGIPTVVVCRETANTETHESGAPDYDHPHHPTTCLSCHHGIRRAEGGA